MRCTSNWIVVVGMILGGIAAPGERACAQVQELRQQIELLQQQVDKLETTDRKNNRVTEIGTQRMQPREVGYNLRLYDIGDLFAVAPTYEARALNDFQLREQVMFSGPDMAAGATGVGGGTGGSMGGGMGGVGGAMGGGMGGMGGGMFNVPAGATRTLPTDAQHIAAAPNTPNNGRNVNATRTSIDDLIEAITTTISPGSWNSVGGEGSIARLGNSLLISAEPKTHEQIEALLGLFRQRWKTLRTVSLRAHWLWLTEAQLATLLPDGGGEDALHGVVADAAWQKRPQPDAKLGSGYRAALTCYNGQTVHVLAGGQSLSITDVETVSVKQPDPKNPPDTLIRPKIVSLQDGAGLQVTPLVSSSGKFVILDVHSRVARINRAANVQRPAAGAEGPKSEPQVIVAAIDRPTVVAQRLSTTLRVPVDRFVLVGGMNFDGDSPANDANLYLFVRASVQELQDELPAAQLPAPEKGPPAKPKP